MNRARMRTPGLACLALGLSFALADRAAAQTTELTSADRLALLYTSQLSFDESGEPIVKVGVADGLTELSFEPLAAITVLPTGPGGPELTLPAGRTYRVTIRDGKPGAYQHYVVLERFRPGEGAAAEEARARWSAAGVPNDLLEVGSLFAISATMFDSRESLVVSQALAKADDAAALETRLEAEHAVDLSIHSELSDYPTATLELTGLGDGIVLRHQDVVWVDLGDSEATIRDLPGERGEKADRTYAASLVFTADQEGRLALVNMVPVETVLRGVVPSEIYTTSPAEALKVQAIAARGTLVSQIGARHLADPYNLCDEQHCQVFGGMNAAHSATDDAIEATRGQVIFDGKRIAETYYASNCGGLSETPEAAWGLPPRTYLHAHEDTPRGKTRGEAPSETTLAAMLQETPKAYCNTEVVSSGRNFRWTRTFAASELDALVAARYPDVGRVRDLLLHERGPGGRVSRLEVVGADGRQTVERELAVRRLFGGLKSGLFVLDIARDGEGWPAAFTFRGGGFGHGVGMCQTGAIGMASEGRGYGEILQHYYPGTATKALW